MYRYICILGELCCGSVATALDAKIRATGLEQKLNSGSFLLYAPADTPVLRLSQSSAIIGHAFWRDGNAPIVEQDLLASHSGMNLAERMIRDCWGEYLLVDDADGDRHGVTIMRDPSGGVGCVYSVTDGFVTSDISMAARTGLYVRAIDWNQIQNILVYPHLKNGHTALSGIRELLPGCRIEIAGGRAATEEIWTPWEFVSTRHRHRDRLAAQAGVRSAVSSTVRAWAETDRSVLLELSGGLDSSIVAASLLDAHAEVACCNLTTPVPGADERAYARLMSDLLGVDLHVQTLRMEDARFDFTPPLDAVAPSTWFLQHASNELKEAIGLRIGANSFFSGGGGDTVFCYTKTASPAADAFIERGPAAGIKAIRDLAELHQCTVWKAGRLTARKLLAPPRPPRKPDRSFLSGASAKEVLVPHPWFTAPPDALPGDRERISDLAGNQIFRDGVARNARWSLRLPLLSQPVMEACLKVPSWMWIAEGQNRAVARNAFAAVLPADILYRRSKGTFMNYSGAVYRRHESRIRDYLLAGELAGRGLLATDTLQGFFDRAPDSKGDGFMRIFDLCQIENWIRHQK